jgi:glycosyltransferase involved in cell wall biosynthesis
MMPPEIALLMSTYQRPRHLRLALQSIALQSIAPERMELVVTDDGSTDSTAEIVREFARQAPFSVRFTTHPHTTFQLARCRNEGVRASVAPYLLFLDGDCILPRDHVEQHLRRRQPGRVMAGDCCRLDEATSRHVTPEAVHGGDFAHWAPPSEIRRLRRFDRASRFYALVRHPTKPKLIGNNVGIARSDYERVNGYDENFQGWGCEDDDLRLRLRRSGVRIASILRWTRTYHLWHPTDVTQPAQWKQGANVQYLLRKGRLTRCRNGLVKRDPHDLAIRVVGDATERKHMMRLLGRSLPPPTADRPEVEILLLPGGGRFSGQADCHIVVALDRAAAANPAARAADILVGPDVPGSGDPTLLRFPLEALDQALAAVA